MADVQEDYWYVIRSKPKQETVAAASLKKLGGVEVFCPRILFKRNTKRGLVKVREALFPGYLFGRFDYWSSYKQVSYCLGVSSILRVGEQLAQISPGVIEEIRLQSDEEELLVVPEAAFAPGDAVQVLDGALQGTEGVVQEVLPGEERVRVMYEFLGQEVESHFDWNALFPVKDDTPRAQVLKKGDVL